MPRTELWRRTDDGGLSLDFHRGQLAVWDSAARFTFMIAGTQGGKTVFGPWWLHREIYGPTIGRGAGDYLAVTSSYDLFKLKMLPAIREVFEQVWHCARYWAGDSVLELKDPTTGKFWASRSDDTMWGRIILRSASSKGGLESATAKGAWLDECGMADFRLGDWEAVQRRLALHEGRALGTTTPYNLGWLKSEVYDRHRAGDPFINVVQFSSMENPAFPKRSYDRAAETMQAWKFNMFYRAMFEKPASLILGAWDAERGYIAPVPISPYWDHYIGWDFGGVHMASVWAAFDAENRALYVYKVTLRGGDSTGEHAVWGLKQQRDAWARIVQQATVIEGDAEKLAKIDPLFYHVGGSGSEIQWRRDFGVGGLGIYKPRVSGVEEGIDKIVAILKEKAPGGLYVFNDDPGCKSLRDDMLSYSRKVDALGDPTEEIESKNTWHRIDALRYLCTALPVAGAVKGSTWL